jgi:hypothetical protein
MTNPFALLCSCLVLVAPTCAFSAELIIPRGTVVFGALDERITSNGSKFRVGYPVDGHVWKDVIVDGHTVIPAGTPIVLRISKLDGTGTGGRGGALEIKAISVKARDGSEISLTGGYGDTGNDRSGLAKGLAIVLWPAGFLPGRKAVLDEGTVFDASIPADTRITIPQGELPTLKIAPLEDLTVDVVYDEIDQRAGSLPLELTLCNRPFVREANVTAVNEAEVKPILVTVVTSKRGNPCHVFRAKVNLEALKDHFKPGINRFSVTMSGVEASTVLNVEM